MADQKCYEVDLTIRDAGGEHTISREMVTDAATPEAAGREVWDALGHETRSKMRLVADGR